MYTLRRQQSGKDRDINRKMKQTYFIWSCKSQNFSDMTELAKKETNMANSSKKSLAWQGREAEIIKNAAVAYQDKLQEIIAEYRYFLGVI